MALKVYTYMYIFETFKKYITNFAFVVCLQSNWKWMQSNNSFWQDLFYKRTFNYTQIIWPTHSYKMHIDGVHMKWMNNIDDEKWNWMNDWHKNYKFEVDQ